LLSAIFDKIIEFKASYEIVHFDIGRTNDEPSRIEMRITAADAPTLDEILQQLTTFGAHPVREEDALIKPAEKDRCVPDDFYSTTNHRTSVRRGGRWLQVEHQRMDAVIVLDGDRARCRKLRDIRKGDLVVCGVGGVKIEPEFRERDRLGFAFMTNEISSERRVEVGVARIAAMMKDVKGAGDRIAVVAGPVVVHTGGSTYFCELIRRGYVDVVLAGNALAVHDAEQALFGTSLGVDLETGKPIEGGHRHHMRAINAIRRAGGLRAAVEQGVLASGIMYECVGRGVEYVLAGSVRDDGPLPDTIMNLIDAQDRYAAALERVGLVLVLSTMLHGIGVGNMVPAWVRMVCVDINPAVVTKLADRGSSQTIGLVTDVGLFLRQLASALHE
jgi:lysine-ketoglutarate reductase/saccharopine dehydrogenase-like protein (TIGR00300 family)